LNWDESKCKENSGVAFTVKKADGQRGIAAKRKSREVRRDVVFRKTKQTPRRRLPVLRSDQCAKKSRGKKNSHVKVPITTRGPGRRDSKNITLKKRTN